ncbi:hypothetical protein BDW22DRAFT_1349507 [Trametopsis cervina]|nr:hypothetical protein BDW22DRAFT_1349525 [Trametopsis cervina]KAI0336968.1 hypothetical protein BDW22DRAFT_1349506 [Trametopsis cervina]KAI0336969.1 hypothetical protein BDW22DRAFT_1349507 [Trametopsis cervina]
MRGMHSFWLLLYVLLMKAPCHEVNPGMSLRKKLAWWHFDVNHVPSCKPVMYAEQALGWTNAVSSEMVGENVSAASGRLVYGSEPKVGFMFTMILLKLSLSCVNLS